LFRNVVSAYENLNDDDVWENYKRFLDEVMPLAKELGTTRFAKF
jgi:D-mannonate dehydratase